MMHGFLKKEMARRCCIALPPLEIIYVAITRAHFENCLLPSPAPVNHLIIINSYIYREFYPWKHSLTAGCCISGEKIYGVILFVKYKKLLRTSVA